MALIRTHGAATSMTSDDGESRERGEHIRIKGGRPGAKRRRVGGARWAPTGRPPRKGSPTCPTAPTSRLPKGDWDDSVGRVVDFREPVDEVPLGEVGEKLLDGFYTASAFEDAITAGRGIGRAGAMIGLSPAGATRLKKDLEAHGGAYPRFVRLALKAIAEGEIPRGRATAKSGDADAFFLLLMGGPREWLATRDRIGGQGIIDAAAEAHKAANPATAEATDYMINRWINRGESGENLCKAG